MLIQSSSCSINNLIGWNRSKFFILKELIYKQQDTNQMQSAEDSKENGLPSTQRRELK